MEQPAMVTAVEKLVLAGEQAGFSVEQMIQLLTNGRYRRDALVYD
jgi:hypothetical protein